MLESGVWVSSESTHLSHTEKWEVDGWGKPRTMRKVQLEQKVIHVKPLADHVKSL